VGEPHPLLVAADLAVTYRVREQPGPAGRGRRRARPAVREVVALDGVDLTLHPGDRLGVVGPNGGGKSTLLRVLAGLLVPTGGTVHATAQPVLLGVTAAFDGELSGRDNVVLGLTALGRTRAGARAAAEEVLAFAETRDAADLPLRTWSTGMRARLAFAIATTVRPEVLLVDEALGAGDAAFRARSRLRIGELAEAAGAVVVVSHAEADLRELCTRALCLAGGRIVAAGDVEDVLAAYRPATDVRA
jgi:teichoic acid transport system ATP-binding protein